MECFVCQFPKENRKQNAPVQLGKFIETGKTMNFMR